jgi:hypothetical protein
MEGLLNGLELFMFTNHSTAESSFYKGTSSVIHLFNLVLCLHKVQTTNGEQYIPPCDTLCRDKHESIRNLWAFKIGSDRRCNAGKRHYDFPPITQVLLRGNQAYDVGLRVGFSRKLLIRSHPTSGTLMGKH